MSIVAMKRKSVIQYGSNRSAKPPGGYWLPQGPFGHSTRGLQLAIESYGPVGFSLNGPHRNVGAVGQNWRMSKQGTPFRGVHPIGNGGRGGTYAQPLPVFNSNEVIALGDQYMYVKPSVISTKGMLEKKYRYLNNGKFPNYWVKPMYTGNQVDSASQGVYLQQVSAANICVTDVNKDAKYIDHKVLCSPTLCSTSTARFKYNSMAASGPYTKMIKQPQTASQYTLQIQRKCADPPPELAPYPPRVNGNGAPCTGFLGTSETGGP